MESRYQAHKQCVTDLLELLKKNNVENFHCVNRVELDRQHLANIDLMIAVGGDGTVLSAAHFLDHGTIPLLGINSDPNVSLEESVVVKKTSDERRSHGALCMCTAIDMEDALVQALHGNGNLQPLTRIRCQVKGTFSETRLVPALNDLLIANPSPAAVSRYRMGWLNAVNEQNNEHEHPSKLYGTITRFDNTAFNVTDSINVWSSGMWVSTATGSTAAMQAAGGHVMDYNDKSIQYLIREHMIEQRHKLSLQEAAKARGDVFDEKDINNGFIQDTDKLHIRWNSQRGRIFIDGSHLTHDLELGDEILIDNQAPPLKMFTRIST